MRTSWKLASVALLLAFGVTVGFGWGNITHVWFADKLGVKSGMLNHDEMYGAVLPDIFGYDFMSVPAITADVALHTEAVLFWGLYNAATTQPAKACIYGMFTHSNAVGIKGADWYAHGLYPIPGERGPDPAGWVVQQADVLVGDPRISSYISQLVGDFAPSFLPVVGHTLIETAVDILVKEGEDNSVGAQLLAAATTRSDEVPLILAGVLVAADMGFPTAEYTLAREAQYREEMKQYGKLFMRPTPQVIAVLSQQTALLGTAYLQVYGVTPTEPIDPAKIAEFIQIAIQQVMPLYHEELMATLQDVRTNLTDIGLPIAGPPMAFWGKEKIANEYEGITSLIPTELSLDQNYPNPFNPTTTIAFALPSDQIVTLKVYNAIGQEVATLVNEFKTAGRYSAVWDAKGIPSGVYFCRLQAGNAVELKKMTLLK